MMRRIARTKEATAEAQIQFNLSSIAISSSGPTDVSLHPILLACSDSPPRDLKGYGLV